MAGTPKRKVPSGGGSLTSKVANKKAKGNNTSSNNKSPGKINPFEFRKQKERSEVLGKAKRVDPKKKLTGNARAHAFELRKNTLQLELEQQEKQNVFVDKREKKEEVTKGLSSHELVKMKFNKLMGKAPKERVTHKKKNIYNLADNEVAYTGSALGIKSAPRPEGEIDEEEEQLNEEILNLQEGGMVDSNATTKDGKKKTARERYAEIIAKSKYHKYLRQKEKEDRDFETEELNDALKELQEELYAVKRTKNDADPEPADGGDDYMQLLRTFQMEGRAPASDRSRSQEEIMREESEKLLKLEEQRLKRMLGKLQGETTPRLTSGDDLTDDFGPMPGEDGEDDGEDGESGEESEGEDGEDDLNEAELLADLLDQQRRKRRGGPGAEEEEEEEEEIEDELEEESDIESENEEEEEVEGEEREKKEIPFKIDVPENYKALLTLFEGRDSGERNIIIERIMVGNHYTLNRAQNIPKMRIFLRILWQRFNEVAKFKKITNTNNNNNNNKITKEIFTELSMISKHLWDLSQQFHEITYNLAKDCVQDLYTKFSEHSTSPDKEALTMQIVVTLQLIGNIFPTTDFHNAVVTPAFTLLGHSISLSPLINVSHLARALFLCSLNYNWVMETRRFVTEPLTLLGALLERFADPSPKAKRYFTCPSLFPFDIKNFNLKSTSSLSPSPLDMSSIVFVNTPTATDQQKIDILNFVVILVTKYFELYTDGQAKYPFNDCAPQLFGPIKEALEKLQTKKDLNKSVKELITSLINTMNTKIQEIETSRTALMLQDSGPVLIDSLMPNYNADYNGKKTKMSELPERTLKHMVKKRVRKEQIKAEKELRRDTAYVQQARMTKLRQEDAEAQKHTKKVLAFLQSQAHDQKQDTIRKNPLKFGKKK